MEPGALRDLRVLDFGQYIAGPLLGMLLADQGADVVKVERPAGDPMRGHPAFAVWNRGKRSAVLDLHTPQGRQAALSLAEQADVLIENFRPGVADRLGIGAADLTARNPRLLYVSLPGFGEESPYRDLPAWEPLVGAVTATYVHRRSPDSGGPVFVSLPISSVYAAMVSAAAVGAALFHRERTGEGQRIEVPLHSATFVAIGYRLVRTSANVDVQARADRLGGIVAGAHLCADGRYLYIHGASARERFLPHVLDALGHPEWLPDLLNQQLAAQNPDRYHELAGLFRDLMATKTAREWEDLLGPVAPINFARTIDEWIEEPHALASEIVVQVDDPQHGPMKQVGLPMRLSRTPGRIRGPAPRLGEHTEEALSLWGERVASR